MSELLYRPLYDPRHEIRLVAPGRKRAGLIQKGEREWLLCEEECEGRLQRFEDYFARFWRKAIPSRIAGPQITIRADYRRLKLFVLSLIWRASIAKGQTFRDVNLGPHEEPFRARLYAEDPGEPLDYPMWAGLLVDVPTRSVWDHALLPPLYFEIDGHSRYRSIFGGAVWTLQISPGGHGIPPKGFYLSDRGELTLPCLSWQHVVAENGLIDSVRSLDGTELERLRARAARRSPRSRRRRPR
jgi:hypothetical protein